MADHTQWSDNTMYKIYYYVATNNKSAHQVNNMPLTYHFQVDSKPKLGHHQISNITVTHNYQVNTKTLSGDFKMSNWSETDFFCTEWIRSQSWFAILKTFDLSNLKYMTYKRKVKQTES